MSICLCFAWGSRMHVYVLLDYMMYIYGELDELVYVYEQKIESYTYTQLK